MAQAISARVDGKPAAAFSYQHHGLLATIGRMAAVVDLGNMRFSGVPA